LGVLTYYKTAQVQQMKEMRGTLTHEKQALLKQLGMSWKSTWLESWKQVSLLY